MLRPRRTSVFDKEGYIIESVDHTKRDIDKERMNRKNALELLVKELPSTQRRKHFPGFSRAERFMLLEATKHNKHLLHQQNIIREQLCEDERQKVAMEDKLQQQVILNKKNRHLQKQKSSTPSKSSSNPIFVDISFSVTHCDYPCQSSRLAELEHGSVVSARRLMHSTARLRSQRLLQLGGDLGKALERQQEWVENKAMQEAEQEQQRNTSGSQEFDSCTPHKLDPVQITVSQDKPQCDPEASAVAKRQDWIYQPVRYHVSTPPKRHMEHLPLPPSSPAPSWLSELVEQQKGNPAAPSTTQREL